MILSLLVLFATSIDPMLKDVAPGPNDLGMAMLVEDWVREQGLVDIPPYILALGADRWKDREKQQRAIRDAGSRCFYDLIRGLHCRDAQVRSSCCVLLRSLADRHACFPEQQSATRYFGTSNCVKCGWYGQDIEIRW
jgi:hypothetical protein